MQWKGDPSFAVGIANWRSHYGNQYGRTLKKRKRKTPLNIGLPYDPAIPPLGIFPKDKTFYSTDTCLAMIIAALFIIASK